MSLAAFLLEALFIGHSLVGPHLPGMVANAARAQGIEMRAEAQIINGAPLTWHWQHSASAEGVDGKARLPTGRYDVVVLTEAVPLDNHLRWSGTVENAQAFYRLAVDARPETRVFLYETWHDIKSGTGAVIEHDALAHVPWRQRLKDDLPKWQGVVDAVNAARPAGAEPMHLIPAGQALGRLSDAIDAGEVPGLSSIADLYSDGIHLNDRGLYFVALVMHAAIHGRDPAGLPARLSRLWSQRDVIVTEPMAAAMQLVAREAVEAHAQTQVDRAAIEPLPPLAPAPPPIAPTETAQTGPPPPVEDGIAANRIGFGLAGVTDWTVQQPFIDVFRTARPWTGHLPGQWGGWGHDELAAGGWLDAEGWPRAIPPEVTSLAALILTDLPETAVHAAGRYVLTYEGRGEIRLEGRARPVEQAPGRIVFDYRPGPGPVIVTLAATDPEAPIRRIIVVREDRLAAHEAGALFNPDWIARLRGVRLIRFMDWMGTNDSRLSRLEDRPRPQDYTWARTGVPVEVMVALANELGADPWFTVPHLAEDALVRDLAETVRRGLDPGLRAYVEFSNEVWNWQFSQAHWAEAQGQARWGRQWSWVQAYAARAVEVVAIWSEVFVDAPDRLVRVLATQTGWIGIEADILNAPLWVAEQPGRQPPYRHFDAWAVTGYFAAVLGGGDKAPLVRRWLAESRAAAEADATARGLAGAEARAHVDRHRYDLAVTLAAEELRDGRHSGRREDTLAALLEDILPHHARVARDHGLRLVMYEGGTHVVGMGAQVEDAELTDFFTHLNYTDEMGRLYRDLVFGWQSLSDEPFNAFVDVKVPSRWGSWGALRHLGDDNPRWRAIADGGR
ncbi:MAG: hypothetical protein ACK4KW_02240 [Gemmobacter sp.]